MSKFKEILKTLRTGADNSYRSFRFTPEGVIAFLTYRCTSRCLTCNIWKRPTEENKELSWEEWKPILEKMAKDGVRSIELFGGDALLRKDLLIKIIRRCGELGIKTFFPTNSNLIDDETARELVEAGLFTIYFSLDELPSLKGAVRGVEDHFGKVDRAVSLIKKYRGDKKTPHMVAITTVSRLNFRLLDRFIEYVESVPFDMYMLRGISEFSDASISRSAVDGVLPDPYFTSTGGGSNLFSASEAAELIKKLKEIRHRPAGSGSVYINTENVDILTEENLVKGSYPEMKCQFCTTQLVLTPYGEVVPCLYFSKYVLGDLKKQDIKEVWGNKRHREFCAEQKKGGIDLCGYCGIKFYHKSFSDTVISLAGKVKEKISGAHGR